MAKHTKPIKESVWAYCRRNRLESVLMQWHPVRNRGVTPDEVPAGSHRHVWWMCKQGHEWQAEVRCRTLYGNGCPFCANRAVLPGFNDLATLYPELAAEWHPTKNGALTPEQVLAGSEKRVWWQCGRGHAWQTSVSTRTRANCRCPVCAGRTVLAGENDLATLSPELAAEWHPTLNGDLTPDMVTPGTRKRAWWICPEGHVWNCAISSRTAGRRPSGCPVCAGNAKENPRYEAVLRACPEQESRRRGGSDGFDPLACGTAEAQPGGVRTDGRSA